MPANDVESLGVPTAPKATGPKYSEDANLLEAEESEDSEEVSEEAESELSESDESEEEEDSDTEDEDSDEANDEDKQPIKIAYNRPSVSEIKAKYPDLFKDFPELKESYFRELKFTQYFPTVEDAKEAVEENEAFTVLSDSALAGDPQPLLESIGKADPRALEVFSMSFLPALLKKDTQMYNQVVTPLFQNLVQTLFKDKDENTQNAALVLAEWMFGDDGDAVARGTKSLAKSIQLDAEQQRLRQAKEQQQSTAFRTSVGRVQDNITRSLESMILKSPSFDPNKVFSPTLRKMGAKEVIKDLMSKLQSDQSHMTVMASRWKRARSNGFTSDDESKIVSTYLARAKSLIPSIASKKSSEMLGSKTKHNSHVNKPTSTTKFSGSGRPTSNGNRREPKDYAKMSDMDILNS